MIKMFLKKLNLLKAVILQAKLNNKFKILMEKIKIIPEIQANIAKI